MDRMTPLDPIDPNAVLNRQSSNKSKSTYKPLPPPPITFDRTRSEAPVTSMLGSTNESPSHLIRPSLTGQSSFQRPRKRVIWRNKACIIALPFENDYGQTTTRIDYLKPQDVQSRLKEWEQKGYNTQGFIVASPTAESTPFIFQGQSRAIHPNPEDDKHERSQRSYRVNIPNRQEWEAYVTELKEEKLRALGVTFSDEEPPSRKSPAPSLMSRQASSQSSAMLASPSLQGSVPPNPFGPSHQFAPIHTGKPAVSLFPRYSMALPLGDKPLPFSGQLPISPSPVLRNGSPFGYISPPLGSRNGSPSINEQLASLSHPSLAPAQHSIQNGFHQAPRQDSYDDQIHRFGQQHSIPQGQQVPPKQLQQGFQPRPQPNMGASRNSHNGPVVALDQAHIEIHTPTPRGHRQNPSESLQQEVEEAEAYLSATDKQAFATKNNKANFEDVDEDHRVVTIAESLKQETLKSEGLNKKAPQSSIQTEMPIVTTQSETKHGAKSSISSKLNVNAPEFRLEPKSPFNPGIFDFLPNQQPTTAFSSGTVTQPGNLAHMRKTSLARAPPRLNAAAPAFTPGSVILPKSNAPSRVFSFGSLPSSSAQIEPKPNAPTKEFSFSSKPPAFNPDAPTFKPSESSQENSVNQVKKIFGNVSFSDASKPVKKSKALPIIDPEMESDSNVDSDGPEDESGRITQSDARQKRMRRDQTYGDQVPQFATPQDGPRPGNRADDHNFASGSTQSSSSSQGEPTTLEAATDLLEEIIDDMSVSEASSLLREDEASQTYDKAENRSMLQDVDQTEIFNAARPLSHSREEGSPNLDLNPEEVTSSPTQGVRRNSTQCSAEFGHEMPRSEIISRSSSGSSDYIKDRMSTRGDRIDRIDHARIASPLRQDVLDGVRYVEPTYDELDAVVKHLNPDGDSDIGIERSPSPRGRHSPTLHCNQSPLQAVAETVSRQLLPPANIRSDAPSPSPNRLREPFQYLPPTDTESADSAAVRLVACNARYSPSYRPSRHSLQVNRLNSPGSTPPSDWNDGFSSVDEDELKSRTGFFDHRINDLIGDALQRRISPLETTLSSMQNALTLLAKGTARTTSRRPRTSGGIDIEDSDADDEDDAQDASQSRPKSPVRDRKYDQLKASITDMAAAQRILAPASQLKEVMNAVIDLKASVLQAPRATTPAGDIKHVVDEAVNRQMRGKSAPVISTTQAAAAEKSQLHIAGLESMLKIAEDRAEDEMKARRATEDALADNQRLLRQALHEIAQQRESAEATEAKLQEYHEERHQHLKHSAMLEGAQESLEKQSSDLIEKNEALESTLAEYRLSHDQWRTDIDNSRHENKELHRNMHSLKAEVENGGKERDALRIKFTQLQESMAAASRSLTADRSRWRSREDEYKGRLDLLAARLEAEARTRERLELEIERLEVQEKEAMKARFHVEQTQKANAHLDKLVGQFRSESHEHQNAAARLKRELHAAKETGIMEVHRTRSAMETDIKASKSEVNLVRAELQNTVARLEKQLKEAALDADAFRSRHELMLEEASESRHKVVKEAADARENALQEHHRFHDRTLEELKVQHQHTLDNALRDKQRSETLLGHRLSFADEKLVHLQDKVAHLEEKLEISKSAAHAAVQAVQANKTAASPPNPLLSTTRASDTPKKVSPQALRESILVLQEQLQARESNIETLEAKLSAVDTEAPTKLKEADIEISWLRELLGVRIDDLQDIISTLTKPSYDRDAVRDAAIRLKANLQMKQQEKERAIAGGQSLPSLSNITNLAASPRNLPLAAAAAWGNWRKGRDTGYNSLVPTAIRNTDQTPSKPSSSPQSFFAGLMTPPSTNLKTTPPINGATTQLMSSSRPLDRAPSTPRQSKSHPGGERAVHTNQRDPITPPLMRKGSYDLDAAEAAVFGGEHEDEQTNSGYAKGDYEVADEEEPFGPRIGTFA